MKSTISVAIITRNRQLKLYKCLNGLTKQTKKPLEVLVIDNGSQDKTKEVTLSFSDRLPIRYFLESKIGIPFARNRALKEAQGEILAFIDDDCVPASYWLEAMLTAHRKNKEVMAIQGRSIGEPLDSLFGLFSHIAHELTIERNLTADNCLFYLDTKNVSFKMQTIRKHKLKFNTNLPRGSDVDFSKQILSCGGKILFFPKAKIYFSPRENLVSFLVQRFRWGKANVIIGHSYPQEYFAPPRTKPRLSILTHPLVDKYWYKRPFFLILINLAFMAEKLGRKIGKNKFQYNRLGYQNNLRLPYTTPKIYRTITVAIITRNRPELLKLCLNSLSIQTRKPDEVLIIDSSDNDQSSEVVEEFSQRINNLFYVSMLKRGRGVARNLALDLATSDLLAFIDDDIEADPLWIAQMVAGHNKYRKLIALQGRILSKPESSIWALVEQYRMDKWFIEKINRDNMMEIITTKNVSFKLKRINKLKLRFIEHPNPEFADMIGEDVDFAKRILNAKQTIGYLSSALTYHRERASLNEFLRQQYRKGYSYWLNKKSWAKYYNRSQKHSLIWLVYDRVFVSIFDMFWHPLLRGKLLKFPFITFVYGLSVVTYFKGFMDSLRVNQSLDVLSEIEEHEFIEDVTIAIATRNRAGKLKKLLTALTGQQAYPKEILVVDNGSSDDTVRVIDSFKLFLPIRYLYELKKGVAFARNKALRNVKTDLIIYLDDDCEPFPNWLKLMYQGYLKYPEAAAIQGWPISFPPNLLVSIIARFNRQTWFRDNMISDRDKFWDLVSGRIEKQVNLLLCDTRNVCLNAKILNKYKVRFEQKLADKGDDYDLAKQLLHHKLNIVFFPASKLYHYERASWVSFLRQRYQQGQASKFLFLKWSLKYFSIIKRNFFKRFAAFVYFSLKNKYFIKLPFLIVLFTLSEIAYGFGKRSQIVEPSYRVN